MVMVLLFEGGVVGRGMVLGGRADGGCGRSLLCVTGVN